MNYPPDSSILLISFILSEKQNYSNETCVFGFVAKMGGAYSPGSFCENNFTLIHISGRSNIMDQIQCLVQYLQAISTWKRFYIRCYGRLGVEVLRDFNHCTIQVYVYTHALLMLTVVHSSRHHKSIYAKTPVHIWQDMTRGLESHWWWNKQFLFCWYKITLYPPLLQHTASS